MALELNVSFIKCSFFLSFCADAVCPPHVCYVAQSGVCNCGVNDVFKVLKKPLSAKHQQKVKELLKKMNPLAEMTFILNVD